MKQLLILAVIAASFTMTSCKKDYTCACTINGQTTDVKYPKVTKKDAKAACEASDATAKASGGSCTLK